MPERPMPWPELLRRWRISGGCNGGLARNKQLKLLCHVLRHPEEEAHKLTFTAELSLKREAKLRIGGPRKNWVKENVRDLWARFGNERNQFANTPEQRNQ
eukprot:55874-Alexandrium_andersonii.AAC.1